MMYSVVPNAGDDPECGCPVFEPAENAAYGTPSIPLMRYFFDVWLPLKSPVGSRCDAIDT